MKMESWDIKTIYKSKKDKPTITNVKITTDNNLTCIQAMDKENNLDIVMSHDKFCIVYNNINHNYYFHIDNNIFDNHGKIKYNERNNQNKEYNYEITRWPNDIFSISINETNSFGRISNLTVEEELINFEKGLNLIESTRTYLNDLLENKIDEDIIDYALKDSNLKDNYTIDLLFGTKEYKVKEKTRGK
jgi:hypothetical protein